MKRRDSFEKQPTEIERIFQLNFYIMCLERYSTLEAKVKVRWLKTENMHFSYRNFSSYTSRTGVAYENRKVTENSHFFRGISRGTRNLTFRVHPEKENSDNTTGMCKIRRRGVIYFIDVYDTWTMFSIRGIRWKRSYVFRFSDLNIRVLRIVMMYVACE